MKLVIPEYLQERISMPISTPEDCLSPEAEIEAWQHNLGVILLRNMSSTPWFHRYGRTADAMLFLALPVPADGQFYSGVLWGLGGVARRALSRCSRLGLLLRR